MHPGPSLTRQRAQQAAVVGLQQLHAGSQLRHQRLRQGRQDGSGGAGVKPFAPAQVPAHRQAGADTPWQQPAVPRLIARGSPAPSCAGECAARSPCWRCAGARASGSLATSCPAQPPAPTPPTRRCRRRCRPSSCRQLGARCRGRRACLPPRRAPKRRASGWPHPSPAARAWLQGSRPLSPRRPRRRPPAQQASPLMIACPECPDLRDCRALPVQGYTSAQKRGHQTAQPSLMACGIRKQEIKWCRRVKNASSLEHAGASRAPTERDRCWRRHSRYSVGSNAPTKKSQPVFVELIQSASEGAES